MKIMLMLLLLLLMLRLELIPLTMIMSMKLERSHSDIANVSEVFPLLEYVPLLVVWLLVKVLV